MIIFIIFVLLGGWFLTNYVIGSTYLGVRLSVLWRDPTGNIRFSLYQDAANVFLSNPVAGVGLGNFKIFSATGLVAHSDYGEVLADTGLFGAIFYFSMYIVLWLRLNRLDRVVTEPSASYTLRLFKAIVIVLLFIGVGQPNYDGVFKMCILASMIGYTIIKERQIRNINVSLRLKPRFS
jgi:O-antigen ligase